MSEGARSYETWTIHPEMTVRQVVADFPSTREVFRRHGPIDLDDSDILNHSRILLDAREFRSSKF